MNTTRITQYRSASNDVPTIIIGKRGDPFIDKLNTLAGQGLTMGEAITQALRELIAEGHPVPRVSVKDAQ
jgi:hypothetical protein